MGSIASKAIVDFHIELKWYYVVFVLSELMRVQNVELISYSKGISASGPSHMVYYLPPFLSGRCVHFCGVCLIGTGEATSPAINPIG